jgi:hypothetical protein
MKESSSLDKKSLAVRVQRSGIKDVLEFLELFGDDITQQISTLRSNDIFNFFINADLVSVEYERRVVDEKSKTTIFKIWIAGTEIDLVALKSGKLVPVEVKLSTPENRDKISSLLDMLRFGDETVKKVIEKVGQVEFEVQVDLQYEKKEFKCSAKGVSLAWKKVLVAYGDREYVDKKMQSSEEQKQ